MDKNIQLIIPMSGVGKRFIDAGYADTKLIPSSVMTNYNSHMSFYSRTQSLNSGVDIGSHQNLNYFLQVYTVGFGGGTRSSLQRNDYDFAFYQSFHYG